MLPIDAAWIVLKEALNPNVDPEGLPAQALAQQAPKPNPLTIEPLPKMNQPKQTVQQKLPAELTQGAYESNFKTEGPRVHL